MAFFKKLFGRALPEPRDTNHLRDLIFHAAAAGDQPTFEKLCRKYADTILRVFAEWICVPDAIRSDPPQLQCYADGLINVAHYFAEVLVRPELLEQMTVPTYSNPLAEDKLVEADALIADMRYHKAAGHLQPLLQQIQSLHGPEVGHYLALIHERLGTCHFHLGRTKEAREAWERALMLCEQDGDDDGVISCLRNLYEIHRYLGEPEAAALCAERTARMLEAYGQPADAARLRRKATMVRAGEPLNRVVVEVNGESHEMDELPISAGGKVRFCFERNRRALRPSAALVDDGMKIAETGQFEKALAIFQEAAKADPYNPDPHYQSGVTLLYLRRYMEAAEIYARVEQLAPGWFHCRTYAWLAEQLASGGISHKTFLLLRDLEEGTQSPEEKVCMAADGLKETPQVALLYLFHGKNLRETGNRAKAEATYRKGLRYAAEPDVQTRLLAELGMVVESEEEKRQLLQQAVALNGNLVSAKAAAWVLKTGLVQ